MTLDPVASVDIESNSSVYTSLPLRPHNLIERKTFRHTFMSYLKDSNAYTNTYFSRYFEWQGVCRELFFHQCFSDNLMALDGAFLTRQAHQDYIHETFPMQTITGLVNTYNIESCSLYLLIRFFIGDSLVSRGYQQLVFQNREKKVTRLPAFVVKKAKEYECNIQEMTH